MDPNPRKVGEGAEISLNERPMPVLMDWIKQIP